jgi:hypothetical protein
METVKKRGTGYFLLGAWGCPPALKLPQDWGVKGVDQDYFSVLEGMRIAV